MDRVWAEFSDPTAGGLYDIAANRGEELGLLPVRGKPVQDTPTPSPNGVAAIVCARLRELTGESRWQERATSVIECFAGRAEELGLYAATFLLAVDW
jgi:uncharacterized protein YyaL (SSP411 family)